MSSVDESRPTPFDGAPLTTDEIKQLRKVLRDEDRAAWARKQLRILTPIVVAVVVGAWQLWQWISNHLSVKP